MKTTNPTFLAKQLLDTIQDDYRIELYHQFSGAITDRDSATQIKVSGDATGLLSNGDTFIIPTDDFETEHVITTAPSFAGGKTTLICSGSTFATTVVGLDVAKKYNVTADVMDQGFTPIRIGTEGETLNSHIADDVEITLDNELETYFDDDGSSGMFNSSDVFWVKMFFKLKNDSTEFLMFGGTVYDVLPLAHNQTIKLYCQGHLKELERYPGWYVNNELGELPNITGVTLLAINESAAELNECRKTLELTFSDKQQIKGLSINVIHKDTPEGMHILKFHPPNLFQYDYGSWTAMTEAATAQTLTAKAGHTITVDMPETFDVVPLGDMFPLPDRLKLEAELLGIPQLRFGNGPQVPVLFDFERVIRYDDGASSYTDITHKSCTYESAQVDWFEAADDVVYIMSPHKFLGIDADLDTDLIGTIAFAYSQGYDDWGTLTPTDGTSNFSQDGVISWNDPGDWRKTDIRMDSVDYNDYYLLRLTCSAYTSGTAQVKRLKRYFRLVADDGSSLDVRIDVQKLPAERRTDDILIIADSSGTLQPCTWKQNISLEAYLKELLDEAEYTSSYRTLDDLKITDTNPFIGLYGRPPVHHYPRRVTAICVDTSTSPETVYLGIEDEIWKVTETGEFEFIDRLDPYIRSSDDKHFKCEIFVLIIDGNGYLQGLAWKDYRDQPHLGAEYSSDIDTGRRTPAIVFRSTSLTAITEQNYIDDSGDSVFTSQEVCFRDGQDNTTHQDIGQYTTDTEGENICVPIPQRMFRLTNQNGVYYPRETLISTTGDTIVKSFWDRVPARIVAVSDYVTPTGDLGYCWTMGQKGFVVWDESNDRWVFLRWNGSNYYICAVNYAGTVTTLLDLTNYQNQVLAGIYYDSKIWFARMVWDEAGGTFPGDYSDCTLESVDTDGTNNSTKFDFSSDSMEANQSLATSDLPKCSILEMVADDSNDIIYGCILNRNDLEYHVFAYDVTNDKLYSSQTSTSFTFDEGRQIKNFVYNGTDVFAVVSDTRYEDRTAFLIKCEFTAPGGAPDGTEITLTYCEDILINEWDCMQVAAGGSGRIYGITAPNQYYMWQYDTDFYPRAFLMNTGDDSFRTIVQNIAQTMNMIITVNANRKIHFGSRDTNKGSMTIEQKDHYLRDTMQPLTFWNHFYDGVEVTWTNPFSADKGTEQAGSFGWGRRILKISNSLIQNKQQAQLLATALNTFFSQLRRKIDFKTFNLFQLENRDKFVFNHNGEFLFTTTVEWIIEELIFDYWGNECGIKALEIKS